MCFFEGDFREDPAFFETPTAAATPIPYSMMSSSVNNHHHHEDHDVWFPQRKGLKIPLAHSPTPRKNLTAEELLPIARKLLEQTPIARQLPAVNGFVTFGDLKAGQKVLMTTNRLQDPLIIEVLIRAMEEKGIKPDLFVLSDGPMERYYERELEPEDEIRAIIRRVGWWEQPRKYDGNATIEDMVERYGYDVLLHGDPFSGGPCPPHFDKHGSRFEPKYIYHAIPWMTPEIFASEATLFPQDLNKLINDLTWRLIWKEGRGGKVTLSDPEGTQLEYTLQEDYYTGKAKWGPGLSYGHIFGHPIPPIIPEENLTGVVSGTTNHIGRPYPNIKVHIEGGRVERIEGGGKYGNDWRALQEETANIQYPFFPRKGLFWQMEWAIATNPKAFRPSNVLMLSGGNEVERNRSGVIHMGFGTTWRSYAETWAGRTHVPYGHVHVHLLFPTMEITKAGKAWTIIENGHLSALDDPEVIDLARKYGDPERLLKEEWIPRIPGISAPGDYSDYAADPAKWIAEEIAGLK
jgi:hypothetical protein